MKIGDKIKTKPIIYIIKITSLSKDIPKEQYIDFAEWLASKTNDCALGRNSEYYAYTENHEEDIRIGFTISLE